KGGSGMAKTVKKAAPAEAKAKKLAAKKASPKKAAKPKKKAADDDSDDSTGEKKSKDSAGIEDEEEGGFSFKWIIWGVTGLVVVALVVMKVLGIGGKKGGED
ncbi:MAG TPA: hypothetical protein PLA50_18975, partial [Bacteroidia bacterium]|nr:hypothetical protein [Bacteroidia bacterium]